MPIKLDNVNTWYPDKHIIFKTIFKYMAFISSDKIE